VKAGAEKATVISALVTRGVMSDEPFSVWVYMLKRDGVPVITEPAGNKLKHRIVQTSLSVAEIKQRRAQGLNEGMRCHRYEDPKAWPALIEAIDCVFARDEAAEYLRSILKRQRVVDSFPKEKRGANR
jgi:hypothetical protein